MITSIWRAMQSLARTQCSMPSHAQGKRRVCVCLPMPQRVPYIAVEWVWFVFPSTCESDMKEFGFFLKEKKTFHWSCHSIVALYRRRAFFYISSCSFSTFSTDTAIYRRTTMVYGVHLRREKRNNFVCTFLYCRWWCMCVCVCRVNATCIHLREWNDDWCSYACICWFNWATNTSISILKMPHLVTEKRWDEAVVNEREWEKDGGGVHMAAPYGAIIIIMTIILSHIKSERDAECRSIAPDCSSLIVRTKCGM